MTLALDNLLQANGIPLKSVHFVQIPYANTGQALRTHQVAAFQRAMLRATADAYHGGPS